MNLKLLFAGFALLLAVVVVQGLLPDSDNTEPPMAVPVMAERDPPGNATEAVGDTLTDLEQFSRAYELDSQQQQDIRRIIESANYAP